MNIPEDLLFTENDEWVRPDGKKATIGITDYAQDQLSDIVYVEYSVSAGDTIENGDTFGAVESVKAASDVYSPVSGTIEETNDLLEETPEAVNTSPYGDAWMLVVEMSDPSELDSLMDAAKYANFLKNRDH